MAASRFEAYRGTDSVLYWRWLEYERWSEVTFKFPPVSPYIAGILNVTPDSFSDGGRFLAVEKAVRHALTMAEAGADIIDVGGQSTRPGFDPVSIEEEEARVLPVLSAVKEVLANRFEGRRILISLDTDKPALADKALSLDLADMLNDESGGDKAMALAAVRHNAPLILMHRPRLERPGIERPSVGIGHLGIERTSPVIDQPSSGIDRPNPETERPSSGTDRPSLVTDRSRNSLAGALKLVKEELADLRRSYIDSGLPETYIALDPGLGFGKDDEENLAILRDCALLAELGSPLYIGASRKRFIGHFSGNPEAGSRLGGSLATALWAASSGAAFLRVHDVKETVEALAMQQALNAAKGSER
jgi:dihydropteroate synthase